MKKTKLYILFALLAFGPTVWAQFGGGSGTAADPYIIHSATHWNELATYVANGNNTEGVYFKQDSQIYPHTMIGTSQYPFKGFYYGDGNRNHDMEYTLTATEAYAAPFRYVDGATISNLRVNISQLTTSAQFAGGLIGHATGEVHINGCTIDGGNFACEIISTVEGNGSHGGFVGYQESGHLTITNCFFAGKLSGSSTTNCGGFVGWSESYNGATMRLVNCLFSPTSVTMSSSGSQTFVRASDMNYVTIHNCYYSSSFGGTQGGTNCISTPYLTLAGYLGDGWEYSYASVTPSTNLNTTCTAIVYGLQSHYLWNQGEPVNINFTVARADGIELTQGTDYGVVIKNSNNETVTDVTDCGDYTLILTGYDPYNGALMMPFSVVPIGTEDNPYLIYTVEQWNSFANNVNNGNTYTGKFFKLMDNISVTTMVGVQGHHFSGTFDGDGHTITVNYTTNDEFCGPFAYTYGATIMNLATDGTINTSNKRAGGVVGRNGTGCLTMTNVKSSVTINSTYSGSAEHGGLVGYTINADIIGCVFTGSLLGENSNGCSGLIGWKTNTEGSTANITDCIFAPASVTVGTNNAYTFVRNSSGGVVNINNCYYLSTALGTSQGKRARSITGGTDVNVELIGEAVEYNVSGIMAYIYEGYHMQGIKKDGVIYAASNEIVGLEMQYTGSQTPTGEHQNAHYSANNATFFSNWSSIYLWLDESNNNVVLNFIGFDYAFEGNGTEDEPYEIHCLEQWNLLAYQVNNGIRQYMDMYFKLMTDLTVEETFSGTPTTQVGKDLDNPFCGIFDGNGHTITVNYTDNSSHDYCAPFRVIEGATIKNLHVTGSITKTDNRNAGGIVGQALNTCHIIDCRSSVTIYFNDGGDCSSGGIVGDVRQNMYLPATTNLYLTNCAFDGKLVSGDGDNIATNWGGLVGWVNETADAYFENCLFVPQRVDGRIGQYDDTGSRTFARGDGDLHFTNCYYTKYIRGNQGKQAYSITTGECVTVDNAGTPSTTSTIGAIGYGTGVKFNGVLYAANGEIQSLNLSNTPNPGYVADSYIVSAGTLSGSANPYTLTMPNADVIISLAVAEWEGTGTEDDPYLIYVNRQWELLATRVNNPGTNEEAQQGYSGKFFKLMNDLTFDSKNTMTMLGNSEHSFCGTFDGNGHTLTVNLSSGVNYCAPFRFVNGATIRHLHVAGAVGVSRGITDLSSQIKYAGVVGRASGNCNLIDCHSSLNVSSDDVYFGSLSEAYDSGLGGFIGEVASGTVHMDGCVYDGRMTIQREIAIGWGGFIGWIAGNNDAHANITNCLFAPKEIQLTNVSSSRTFARGYNESDVTVTNSYYTQTLGTAQGKQAHSITAGTEGITVVFAGDANENEVSGITTYANNHGMLYSNDTISTLIAGNNDAVSLNLTAPMGYAIGTATYTPEGGSATEIVPVEGVYSFTMPDADVTINVELIAGATQTITLATGWNWWSTNLDITFDQLTAAIADALGTVGTASIKSRNGSLSYANGQWRGSINFDIRQMYKIQVSADCEIVLTGVPVNPLEYEITISHGINWIGFLPNESMSVGEAFSGLNPVEGDVVKSKNGSITYNGTVWRGTLTLEPGNGYIYQSEAAGNKTFTFPSNTK